MPGFYFWGRYFVQDSNNDMEHNFVYLIQTRHHLVDRESSGSSRVTMLCRPAHGTTTETFPRSQRIYFQMV